MSYLPKHFEETDAGTLHALVNDFPLATWVVPHNGELLINHIPFLLDTERGEFGTLVGHVARANPVWQARGTASVAVFNGPQAYVSPSWYPSKHVHGKAVPTWNYAVVHAHGVARTLDDPEQLLQLLNRLTDHHEAHQAHPWKVSDAPAAYIESMLGAIVGIEIPVQRWEGKWKTSQNRTAADRLGVAAGLMAQSRQQVDPMVTLVRQGLAP